MSGNAQKPKLGVNVAFIWGTLNVGCFLYVYFLIPELKGLDLEQVDELYVRFCICANYSDLRKRSRLGRVLLGRLNEVIGRVVMNSRICLWSHTKARSVIGGTIKEA